MPIFGAKSRAMRGCASKLACGHRIGPADCTGFSEIYGEFATSPWADVGIGPYRGICRCIQILYSCRRGSFKNSFNFGHILCYTITIG